MRDFIEFSTYMLGDNIEFSDIDDVADHLYGYIHTWIEYQIVTILHTKANEQGYSKVEYDLPFESVKAVAVEYEQLTIHRIEKQKSKTKETL